MTRCERYDENHSDTFPSTPNLDFKGFTIGSIGYCLFLIRGKWNEYLICGHAGGFFSRLTLRRVMEVESGSERFRVPKTSFQENVLVNDAVTASTNWTLVTKGN